MDGAKKGQSHWLTTSCLNKEVGKIMDVTVIPDEALEEDHQLVIAKVKRRKLENEE